jgi:hypothetical protein
MRITVNNKQRQIGNLAVEQTKAKIEASFSKFGINVVSIELHVEDVNGPKGGIDKSCRIVVKLRKMEDVVVAVEEVAFSKAISRAIRRAERAVGRKIQRRSIRNQGRRPEPKLALYS